MSWIQNIGNAIETVFQTARKPFPSIPPILLLCEIMNRPGLSAISLAAAIIARCEAEGIPTGVNPDGSANMNNKFIQIFSECLIDEIKNNAVVESCVQTGAITITGTGGNAGGPVQITGFNDKIAKIKGVMH